MVGEAKASLRKLSNRIGRGYEEGVSEDPVPPHLREVHKRYFGEVKKRIDAKIGGEGSTGDKDAAPAAEPAENTGADKG